jgi:hypothetical protein
MSIIVAAPEQRKTELAMVSSSSSDLQSTTMPQSARCELTNINRRLCPLTGRWRPNFDEPKIEWLFYVLHCSDIS